MVYEVHQPLSIKYSDISISFFMNVQFYKNNNGIQERNICGTNK